MNISIDSKDIEELNNIIKEKLYFSDDLIMHMYISHNECIGILNEVLINDLSKLILCYLNDDIIFDCNVYFTTEHYIFVIDDFEYNGIDIDGHIEYRINVNDTRVTGKFKHNSSNFII